MNYVPCADFRPDYKLLGVVAAEHFPGVPLMALTATATHKVRFMFGPDSAAVCHPPTYTDAVPSSPCAPKPSQATYPFSAPFLLALQVRQDIVTTLRMRSPAQFTVSFFRPNLLFRVIQAGLKAALAWGCAGSMRRCFVRGTRRATMLSLPPAVCTAHPSWPQKDYARHEESGLEGYLHDMLTYIQ